MAEKIFKVVATCLLVLAYSNFGVQAGGKDCVCNTFVDKHGHGNCQYEHNGTFGCYVQEPSGCTDTMKINGNRLYSLSQACKCKVTCYEYYELQKVIAKLMTKVADLESWKAEQANVTPAPTTPAPSTPAPSTPAPTTPAPTTSPACKDEIPKTCQLPPVFKTCSDIISKYPGACNTSLSDTGACGTTPGKLMDYCQESCNNCEVN